MITIALYLGDQADHGERVKHGIPMPEEDWSIDRRGYAEEEDLPECDYASEVAHCALVDYLLRFKKLEPTMNAVY